MRRGRIEDFCLDNKKHFFGFLIKIRSTVGMHLGWHVVEENSMGNDRKFCYPRTWGNTSPSLEEFCVFDSVRCQLLLSGKVKYAFLTAVSNRHWSPPDILCLLPLLPLCRAKYWDSHLLLCKSHTLCVTLPDDSWTALCLSKMEV